MLQINNVKQLIQLLAEIIYEPIVPSEMVLRLKKSYLTLGGYLPEGEIFRIDELQVVLSISSPRGNTFLITVSPVGVPLDETLGLEVPIRYIEEARNAINTLSAE